MAINKISMPDVIDFRDQNENGNALDYYQELATRSAIYPGQGTPFGLMYAALGLAEAGEFQNKVKKLFRDDGVITFKEKLCDDEGCDHHGTPHVCRTNGEGEAVVAFKSISEERKQQLMKELGGLLWYVAACCNEIGTNMADVAFVNLQELAQRSARGTLGGSGDNR